MSSAWRVTGRAVTRLLCFLVVGMLVVDCSCPSTNPDVSPDCPGGTKAASAIKITANLATIRPLGGTIQLKIRGNRKVDEHLCFQPGAKTSFLINIEGTGSKTENVTNLADGVWTTIEIQALSGGDQAPVTLTKTLVPGMTHTLSISGNAAGDLTATFLD